MLTGFHPPCRVALALLVALSLLGPEVADAQSAAGADPTIVPLTNVWVFLNSSDIPLLTQHTMLYNPTDNSLVCYGGLQQSSRLGGERQISDTVWVFYLPNGPWAGHSLSLNATNVPQARFDHTAVWYQGRMYVYGGQAADSYMNDLWAFDPRNATWTRVDSSGWDILVRPPGISGHTAQVVNDTMYVWGGQAELVVGATYQYTNTMWKYNFASNSWSAAAPATSPPPRRDHTSVQWVNMSRIVPAAFDTWCTSADPCFLVHGGQSDVALNDLWLYRTKTDQWTPAYYQTSTRMLIPLGGASPRTEPGVTASGRWEHQCIMVQHRMLCVGGYDVPGYPDLVEYDAIFNRFLLPSFANSLPFGLRGHQMALAASGVVYVFGGVEALTKNFYTSPMAETAYRRPTCRAGWYAPDGNWMCFACAAGWAAFAQSYLCEQCLQGQYSSPNRDNCIQCAAGYYNPFYGQASIASCYACPPGSYWPIPGGIFPGCFPCGGGQYQDQFASPSCKDCPAGTYRPTPGLNTSLAVDVTYCTLCPPGQFSYAGATVCLPCPPGYYTSASGEPFCHSCPLGSYSNGGLASCLPCPVGTFSTAFASAARASDSCKLCPPGSYNNQTGQPYCALCPAGQYQDTSGQASCKACPAGTYGSTTGQVSAECTPCPAGTYQDLTQQSTCKSCPVATYSTSVGATSSVVCVPCPDGTFSAVGGNARLADCKGCPTGQYGQRTSSSKGLTQCYECEPGTYNPSSNAVASTDCLPCPPMTYSGAGASACTPCNAGWFSHGGWRECVSCNDTIGEHEGFVSNGHFDLDWRTANFTEMDKWRAANGSSLALQSLEVDSYGNTHLRPEAEYTVEKGKLTPGFMRYVINQGYPYDTWTYTQTLNLSIWNLPVIKCSLWTRARYLTPSPTSPTPAVYRARFTFISSNGTTVKDVPFTPPAGDPGLTAGWVYGETEYQPVSTLYLVTVELTASGFTPNANAYVDWDDVSVTPHPSDVCTCIDLPGTYFDRNNTDAITERNCIRCKAGYACRGGAQFKCAPYEMSHGQQQTCMSCLDGWRCTYDGALPCPFLNYINATDNSCYPCRPGFKCGQRTYTACWAGTYGDGGYGCILCLPGSFSNQSGALFCYSCPPGYRSNYMRTGCDPCPAGYQSKWGKECELCPLGTYSLTEGTVACTPCSNITEVVVTSLARNTRAEHINVIPNACAGVLRFQVVNVTHTSGMTGSGNGEGGGSSRVTRTAPDGRSVTYFAGAGAYGTDYLRVFVNMVDAGVILPIDVRITIVNTPPVASDDFVTVPSGQQYVVCYPLVNDHDAESDELFVDSLVWVGGPQPSGVFASIAGGGKSVLVSFPDAYAGTVTNLRYYVNDSLAKSTNFAKLTVCRDCSTPVAAEDSYTLAQNTELTMSVLLNDDDADGDSLSITAVTLSARGVKPTFTATTVHYVAPLGYCGPDSFSYTVSSVDGSDSAEVSLTIGTCYCSHATDTLIMLDGSSPVTSSGFTFQLQFADSFARRLSFNGELGPKLAILQYSSNLTMISPFTGLLSDITSVEPYAAWHNTVGSLMTEALTMANTHFAQYARGAGYPRRVVLLTGMQPTSASNPVAVAAAMKASTLPIKIYVLSVGLDTDLVQLKAVASSPSDKYLYTVLSWNQILSVLVSLADSVCDNSLLE